MHKEYSQADYLISTDKKLLDINLIHSFLTNSYWSPGIPKDLVERKIKNALCFGVYEKTQIGFARVISDFTSFAYLADVFIIEEHRGKKLSKWLIQCIFNHPELQALRCWLLRTRDAHGLYQQFGFKSISHPDRLMEILNTSTYLENQDASLATCKNA